MHAQPRRCFNLALVTHEAYSHAGSSGIVTQEYTVRFYHFSNLWRSSDGRSTSGRLEIVFHRTDSCSYASQGNHLLQRWKLALGSKMSKDRIFRYYLLKSDEYLRNDQILEDDHLSERLQQKQSASVLLSRSVIMLTTSLLISISLNVYSAIQVYHPQPDIGRSPFSTFFTALRLAHNLTELQRG